MNNENEKIAERIVGLTDRVMHTDLKPQIIEALTEAHERGRKEGMERAIEIVENGCFCLELDKTCDLTEAAQAIRTAMEAK